MSLRLLEYSHDIHKQLLYKVMTTKTMNIALSFVIYIFGCKDSRHLCTRMRLMGYVEDEGVRKVPAGKPQPFHSATGRRHPVSGGNDHHPAKA